MYKAPRKFNVNLQSTFRRIMYFFNANDKPEGNNAVLYCNALQNDVENVSKHTHTHKTKVKKNGNNNKTTTNKHIFCQSCLATHKQLR